MAEFARQNVSSTEAFMGLEAHLSRSMIKEICLRKALQSSSVLAAQKRQLEEEGAVDPDKLAEVFSMRSKWARSNAWIKGRMQNVLSSILVKSSSNVICSFFLLRTRTSKQ